ncbi:MAG TPA: hypothetical protein V6C97_14230 [Oculatellaceae cyanobacterium]
MSDCVFDRKKKSNKRKLHSNASTYKNVEKTKQLEIVKVSVMEALTYVDVMKRFPAFTVPSSTFSNWKQRYVRLRAKYVGDGKTFAEAVALADKDYVHVKKKRGAPTLLSPSIHDELLSMLHAIRSSHGRVCPIIVLVAARAVMKRNGLSNELVENGGTLKLSPRWARGIIVNALGWVKRKATSTRKMTDDEKKEAAKKMIELEAKIDKYHPALVVEMDETMAPWAPVDNFTYEKPGTKTVVIQGTGDKRGNTVTITVTRDGHLLPFQNILAGSTDKSVPTLRRGVQWPDGFVNSLAGRTGTRTNAEGKETAKTNKWQNPKTIGHYGMNILSPYFCAARKVIENEHKKATEEKREVEYEMGLRALCVMDGHYSHECDMIKKVLDAVNCDYVLLPPNTTGWGSVLDVVINHLFKQDLRASWSCWATKEITKQLDAGVPSASVQLNICTRTLKPLTAEWIINAWKNLKKKESDLILSGWRKVHDNVVAALAPPASARLHHLQQPVRRQSIVR